MASAALAAGTQVPKVATPGLRVINLEGSLAGFYTEHLAQLMTERGARVISPDQIATLLGLQRQRELAGCGVEASSCLIELANALGVDALLTGDIVKLGDAIQINLRLVSADNARSLASVSTRVADERHVVDALTSAARSLTADLVASLGSGYALAATSSEAPVRVRSLSWIPAVAGGLLAAGSAYLLVQAGTAHQQLLDPTASLSETSAIGLRDSGKRDQLLGAVGLGVGGAALLAGVLMFALGVEAPLPVAVSLGPNGGALWLRGAW